MPEAPPLRRIERRERQRQNEHTGANMNLPDLLPCPFCGAAPVTAKKYVYCKDCGGSGPSVEPLDEDPEAAHLWNRRSPDIGLAEALRDARRYQWLRDEGPSASVLALRGDELDQAVDSALEAAKQG